MPKYLIIEKSCRTVYAYIESGTHFIKMSGHRRLADLLTEEDLNNECDLDAYSDGTYFVFELKETTNGKVKATKVKARAKKPRKAVAKKARPGKAKKRA